jgi:DNA polymerase elongation subunit (family B)
MDFYTDCQLHGNKILLKGVSDGVPFLKKLDYKPSFFTKTDEESKFKTIYGENLKEKRFECIRDAKYYLKDNNDVANFSIYGNEDLAQQYLCNKYAKINYDVKKIKIVIFDIETAVEGGFPEWENPLEEILLVTFQDYHSKRITAFGRKPIDETEFKFVKEDCRYLYRHIPDEREFLKEVAAYVRSNVDILSGWFIEGFDLPYLFARTQFLLGEDAIHDYSPWNIVEGRRNRNENGAVEIFYDIKGISVLDYIDLYKKYSPTKQENYTLDLIANVELGVGKLENPHGSFQEWYKKDFTSFAEYNAVDCIRVCELEEKLNLILMVISIAYEARINFQEVASPVRTWHGILNFYMHENHLAPEIKHGGGEKKSIVGGYVHDPVPGKYDWVLTFDATSLYPSIIMGWNISPETLMDDTIDIDIDGELEKFTPKYSDYTIAMNGHMFSREKQGIIPKVIERVFTERKTFKNKMLKAKDQYEKTGDIKHKQDAILYDVHQLARKILANALYGAMANRYFMFFDIRMAEAVTTNGRFITQRVRNEMNSYLNSIGQTKNYDYVYYGDTDSIFLTLKPIVESKFKGKTTNEIIDLIDKTAEGLIRKKFDSICAEIETNLCSFENRISFKREAIASAAIFQAKKRYAMLVYNNEGVAYDPPTLKITGIEVVRTSTPKKIREYLKEAVHISLSKNEEDLHEYVERVQAEVMRLPYHDVALPKSANNLGKYASPSTIYSKGTPIQVRGVLLFNHYLKKYKLEKKYELIKEGAKIKYVFLNTPNKFLENVLAFETDIPKEFDIMDSIDYNMLFEKGFLTPLDNFIKHIGWSHKPVASLDGLFD